MNEAQQSALRVWVLSDGQPGHYSLARGVLAALERVRPLEVHWLEVRLHIGLARNVLRALLNRAHRMPPLALLQLFYRMPALPAGGCDLIVSAGGKTSFANAWLAGRLNAGNLFFGSLRRLSPALFSLVVTLEPLKPAADNNLVLELPPGGLDAQALQRKGQALRQRVADEARSLWLLMVGGNGAGYRYSDRDWRQLGEALNGLAQRYGVRWLVLSSPRTGASGERRLSDAVDRRVVADACWYTGAQPERVQQYLGAADAVFVTEDSMTMLTEAIYSQKPVVSLAPESVQPTARFCSMIAHFEERRWLVRQSIEALSRPDARPGLARCQPLDASPVESLSKALRRYLKLG